MGKIFSKKIIKPIIFYLSEFIITSALIIWLMQISQFTGNVEVHVKGVLASFITLGVLAYLFGLRHAVDADHLAAIDN